MRTTPSSFADSARYTLRPAMSARFALPVERRVRPVEHIEIDAAYRAARFDDQPAETAVTAARRVQLHGFAIGKQRVALANRRLLLAKEELRRAELERVVAAIED